MSTSIYVAATEGSQEATFVVNALCEALSRSDESVGLFQPVVSAATPQESAAPPGDRAVGVTYDDIRADADEAFATVIERFAALAARCDQVVVAGSDFSDSMSATELALNARIAAHLNAPVVLVVPAAARTPRDVRLTAENAIAEFAARQAEVVAVVAAGAADAPAVEAELRAIDGVTTMTSLDPAAVMAAAAARKTSAVTPLAFQHKLMDMARADKRTIVLPESDDDRILTAAAIVLQRDVANLILLGDPAAISASAGRLGLTLDGAQLVDMTDESLRERFATTYAELRAHKGMTVERAREVMADPSYFGTMMVYLGLADGMVSGACHTTANTIRPSLEFVKTKPGVSVVSGAFLMCMPGEVVVYADCAVNPNPTPAQLADVAISSAHTATNFGIEPRVAMLSYSTGTSGAGPDVDAVAEATQLVHERAPELAVDGPLQFDAAVDPTVARAKLPGSPVAGRATVFVFPDLNTGNNTYKAVQRTSGAMAIGPVLQGLNKPVNDLSRGALVDDIVNTVVITAIQAQSN